jgi:hypothetical protein
VCGEEPPADACTSIEVLCPFFECDPSWQDCMRGERCIPVSDAGVPPWTETRCEPLIEPTQPVGAACNPAGQWTSDCEAMAYCLGEEGAPGECARLCSPFADECDVGTCWPCDFAEEDWVGVCSETELAC